MTCTGYERRIALYVGRELDEADTRVVEAHLGTCAPCRALLEGLRQQQVSLAGWGGQVPTQEDLDLVRDQVLSAVMRGDAGAAPRRWGHVFRWIARGIPAAAAAILLLFIWQSMRRPDVEPSQSRVADARPYSAPLSPTAPAAPVRPVPSAVLPEPTPESSVAEVPRPSRRAAPSQARSRRAARHIEAALAALAAPPHVLAPQLGRIEFKTADPNIRIVWLLPETAPPPPEDRRRRDEPSVHLIEEGRVP